MVWVLLAAAFAYVIANLPLLYSLLRVHGWRGIGWLWGYAPNQFLFLVVVFPFASLYTFLALRVLVVQVRPAIPISDPARFIVDHWSAWLVFGLALVSLITVVVYFGSAMTLDKLRPRYVGLARNAIDRLDDRLSKVPEGERAAKRAAIIRDAQVDAAAEQLPTTDDEARVTEWLSSLEPEVVLQFLMKPRTQLRLALLDPTIHSLNVFQMLVALFVSATGLTCAFLLLYVARILNFPTIPSPAMADAVRLLGIALFFFAIYPLFYNEMRVQTQEFVGQGFSVLQDMLSAALVLLVMLLLSSLQPTERVFSLETAAKYLPVIVITGGFAAGGFAPGVWRQLVGRETTWAIQAILALLFSVMASIPLLQHMIGRR